MSFIHSRNDIVVTMTKRTFWYKRTDLWGPSSPIRTSWNWTDIREPRNPGSATAFGVVDKCSCVPPRLLLLLLLQVTTTSLPSFFFPWRRRRRRGRLLQLGGSFYNNVNNNIETNPIYIWLIDTGNPIIHHGEGKPDALLLGHLCLALSCSSLLPSGFGPDCECAGWGRDSSYWELWKR